MEYEYNIKGKALLLIKSYFEDRTFSVKIQDVQSTPKQLNHGVPQGSLLGPTIYNLYTKPLEYIVRSHGLNFQGYADDCQMYVSFFDDQKSDIEETLKNCLFEIKKWMCKNFLKLNDEKTIYKIFKHKQSLLSEVSLIGSTLPDSVKVLGVYLNNNLNLDKFIMTKVRTCNYHLRNLYNIRDSLSLSNRLLLVTNLILSTIDYCSILLLGSTDKTLRPLKLIINKSLRFIYNTNFRQHISPFYQKSHILPIKHRLSFKACLFGYKILNKISPLYFEDDFTRFIPTGTMSLREGPGRDSFMFAINKNDSNHLTFLIKKEWNGLPIDIRKSESLTSFKSRLKTFLFSKS